jgi:transcriptional regulator with XRE-family HTH domain
VARGLKRLRPISGAGLGERPGHAVVFSVPDLQLVAETDSAGQKIQSFIELAIRRCGSAAALARRLGVKPPTVSQWRARRKNPDAINLIRIQDLANQRPPPSPFSDLQPIRPSADHDKE